ncbi:hypothetical protein ACS0TY_032833 [Phlomoides rotata]
MNISSSTFITIFFISVLVYTTSTFITEAKSCRKGCNLAIASYYVGEGSNLTYISTIFHQKISNILPYNPHVSNPDTIQTGTRINVPFSCECFNGDFLGHTFSYLTQRDDTYVKVASLAFSNLTTQDWIQRLNDYDPNQVPDSVPINVTVNCSCGDGSVSRDYGVFATYPLLPGESLGSLATETGVSPDLLQQFNRGFDFNAGSGIVFLPAKDQNGTYPPLKSSSSSSGISGGAIAVVIGVGIISLAICLYLVFYTLNKKVSKHSFLYNDQNTETSLGVAMMERGSESSSSVGGVIGSPKLKGMMSVDKSVEFTYQELAAATNDFNVSCKIGQGGFGCVYYGELRGQKAGIKKMEMQASKEFLAELKVLTHVHHVNLVHLIGYCVEGSLFLVYEYIDNGNLSQHLRGVKHHEPLGWSTRVQIALDSARGLEYIHEHTIPLYIHRDIKSPNILIDHNFRAKVADFGLTKLTQVGSGSLQTRLVGTFGYMPPEYAQYGEVSPKIDVYAFGVLLFELISAKHAIVKLPMESKALAALFEDAFNMPDPTQALRNLVDPRLGHDYPFDSVSKVAHLAKACTHENPQLRPSMRSIVVALMTLSSSTEDWDIASFYQNQGFVHPMSGR